MLSLFSWSRPRVAIDFGTANLRLIDRDEGVVFDEPSLCCFSTVDSRPTLFAAGAEVRAMVDRTPHPLEIKRPLRRGVLQDIDSARHLLRYAVRRSLGRRRARSVGAVIGVPADATEAERGAMLTVARDAGIGPVRLVPEPFAAAIGAQLPIEEPRGSLVVECGAGTTEVALISLGDICLSRSVRVGGAALDRAIADDLHFRRKFLIGTPQAERVKQDYAERRRAGSDAGLIVSGRCLTSGMPASIEVSLEELDHVVDRHVGRIVEAIHDLLSETPPELSRDIHSHGITLTGGSAVLPRLGEMIEASTGLSALVADQPAFCVARGLRSLLRN